MKHFKKAVEVNDKFVAPHYNIANLHLIDGKDDLAMKEYEAILANRRERSQGARKFGAAL